MKFSRYIFAVIIKIKANAFLSLEAKSGRVVFIINVVGGAVVVDYDHGYLLLKT